MFIFLDTLRNLLHRTCVAVGSFIPSVLREQLTSRSTRKKRSSTESPSRTLTRKFRMCPRVGQKKGWEADAPRDVTVWRWLPLLFLLLLFFFFTKDDDLDYIWNRKPPLPIFLPLPFLFSYCSSTLKRSLWLMVLRLLYRCISCSIRRYTVNLSSALSS